MHLPHKLKFTRPARPWAADFAPTMAAPAFARPSEDDTNDFASPAFGDEALVPDVITDFGLDNSFAALDGASDDAADVAGAPTLSHIGRYALKHRIADGGLGTVFEAWDPLLSRTVAVKTVHLQSTQQAPDRAATALDGLILNEARMAAGLSHRHIVTVYDAGLSAQGVYIAMERLHGRDLRQALAQGWRPRIDHAAQLIRRVADALSYAHAKGVVHCDIKPANIFLTQRSRPKVLDFGIARAMGALGAAAKGGDGAVMGSPHYLSPEQLRGEALDARSDVYSLGVVAYELLTGQKAFKGNSLSVITQAVLRADARPAHLVCGDVPPALSAIVARAMSARPSARFGSATEFSIALHHWQQEMLADAPTFHAPRANKPRAGNALVLALAALAAAAAIGAAIAFALGA